MSAFLSMMIQNFAYLQNVSHFIKLSRHIYVINGHKVYKKILQYRYYINENIFMVLNNLNSWIIT